MQIALLKIDLHQLQARVDRMGITLDGATKVDFSLWPCAFLGIDGPVDEIVEHCPRRLFKQLLRLLTGSLVIGFTEREEEIGGIGKSRIGTAQLNQGRIYLSHIPKRRSEPVLCDFVVWVEPNCLAQKHGALCRDRKSTRLNS